MKAVLWFSFQHNIIHYIGICSYQWKAALLMRTPFSTAVSSCRFYGIGIANNGTRKSGVSDKARQNFNADTRMVLLEEGATTSQPFFWVSGLYPLFTCVSDAYLTRRRLVA